MRKYFTFIIALLYSLSIYAGNDIIGIKGGISLFQNQEHTQPYGTYLGYKTGASLTIFGEKAQNRYLYHSVQLSYYQAGGEGSFYSENLIIVLDNIGLGYNFLVKYPQKQFTPYLSVGMSFDYLININEYMTSDNVHIDKIYPPQGTYVLHKFNIRPLISIGTENNLNKFIIVLDYVFSFDLFPSYDTDFISHVKFRPCGHLFNAGVKFEI